MPAPTDIGSLDPAGVGLVHDYLLVMRGAERTFAQIAACWPQAPIYTLLYDEEGTQRKFADRVVRTSYLQRLPVRQRSFRMLLPLLPRATELLRLDGHRVVVSSSSAFAHGIHPPPGAMHVNYCHSPFRYVWHERERALAEVSRPLQPVLAPVLEQVRAWDVRAAARVDHFIANSQLTRERIAAFWGRDSVVIHPPVDTDRFYISEPHDYLLCVGEVVAHKRVDLALEAARRAGRPIKVVGDGPALPALKARYGEGAEFLGRLSDEALAEVMSHAHAVVVPNVEEFGIAAVEAQAAGRPVVAPDAGGTRETVIDGQTGVLYRAGDGDSLTQAIRDVDFDRFDAGAVRRHALRFSAAAFRQRLLEEVQRVSGGAGSGARVEGGASVDGASVEPQPRAIQVPC